MAIYRTIQLSFWTDEKVLDDFTPEDKYFYLYLFTNPQTNLCGCYELGWTQTTSQTGYTKDTILRLLDRFENVHKVLCYSKETKEVLLLNWHKYNWTTSADFMKGLNKQIDSVKNPAFREMLISIRDNKTVLRPSMDGGGTSVTVTVNNTVTNTDSIKEIIDYLNIVTNSNYTYKNKSTNSLINARLTEGHTVEDFKTVIDKKWNQWKDDPKMVQYCRPATLFAPSKFESYLNEKIVEGGNVGKQSILDIIANS